MWEHDRLLLFVVKHRDLYTANQEFHGINAKYNTNLYLPVTNLTAFQRGAYFLGGGIKLFNHLPINIQHLSNETKLFRQALKRVVVLHSFYSIEEYFNYNNQ